MITQLERLDQVRQSERIIAGVNKELLGLHKTRDAVKKTLAKKDLEETTKIVEDLEKLDKRIAALIEKRLYTNIWIDTMKSEAAADGLIRVINQHKDRVEIVIHYAAENGRKLSYTRHVRWDGAHWMGISTVAGGIVAYDLGYPLAKAA